MTSNPKPNALKEAIAPIASSEEQQNNALETQRKIQEYAERYAQTRIQEVIPMYNADMYRLALAAQALKDLSLIETEDDTVRNQRGALIAEIIKIWKK